MTSPLAEREDVTRLARCALFARPHKSVAKPYPRTPATAAGIADHIWTCEEIAALLD